MNEWLQARGPLRSGRPSNYLKVCAIYIYVCMCDIVTAGYRVRVLHDADAEVDLEMLGDTLDFQVHCIYVYMYSMCIVYWTCR